ELSDRLQAGGTPPLWIGLRKDDRTGLGEFSWVSGERVLSAHWTVHEPRLVPPLLDCAVQLPGGAWEAEACDQHHPYPCEHTGWVELPRNRPLYHGFVGSQSWIEARDTCAALGAHLVTLGDVKEQAFVTSHFQGFIWVGGQREGDTKTFRWVTG